MSSYSKLLSIGIPTYNRAQYVKENLEQLLPQIVGKEEFIEVIVNDNASVDNTEDVVKDIQKKYASPVVYTKHPVNLGQRKNLIDIMSKVKGRFIYILGDDDIVSPDFIDITLKIIKQNENLGLILFNYLRGDSRCSDNLIEDAEYDHVIKVYSFYDYIVRTTYLSTFTSTLIFAKSVWDDGELYVNDKYYGYEEYARYLWGAIDKKCVYYYMPVVIQRSLPREWDDKGALFSFLGLCNLYYDLDKTFPGIYKFWQTDLRTTHNIYRWLLPMLVKNQKLYRTKIKEFNKHLISKPEKIFAFLFIYVTPIKVLVETCKKMRNLILGK
jgi:glycosyltransferase involved in cell wall biosynthesis